MVNMVISENNQKDVDRQNLDGQASERAGLGRCVPLGTVCDVEMLVQIGTNKVLFWPAAPLALPSIEVTGTFYILAA
jgi:hypothetical protein